MIDFIGNHIRFMHMRPFWHGCFCSSFSPSHIIAEPFRAKSKKKFPVKVGLFFVLASMYLMGSTFPHSIHKARQSTSLTTGDRTGCHHKFETLLQKSTPTKMSKEDLLLLILLLSLLNQKEAVNDHDKTKKPTRTAALNHKTNCHR